MMKDMAGIIFPLLGFVFAWFVLRSIVKTFNKINLIEENQKEMIDLLTEIKDGLKQAQSNKNGNN